MTNTFLPSLSDTQYCVVDEIQKSMLEKYEISMLEKIKKPTKADEVRLRRRKRNSDLINLEQSAVLSEIFYLYFKQNKFNAGIYFEELKNETYFDRDKKNALTIPITSGQRWKEYEDTSEIRKWKEIKKGSKESDVPLILYQLLDMAEQTKIPPLQKVIDHSMTGKDEEEKRKIFNRTLNINLTRHINDWSELRENSRRELLHSSFRSRLKDTLENLSWIKIIEENNVSEYFYDDSTVSLPPKDGPNEGIEYKQLVESLLKKMKQFHNDIQGYDEEYFEKLQDLEENTNIKINAPQIFRTNVLEEKLFPFLFKEEKLKLSIQDIYNLLSEFLNRYISSIQKTVSDIVISDDGEESSLSDLVAEKENIPDMDEGILRKDLIQKINNFDKEILIKIQAVYIVSHIKERISYYKDKLNNELNSSDVKNFSLIIKTEDNSRNFPPIGINMRVNRIDEIIKDEIINDFLNIQDPVDELIQEVNSYLSPVISDFPEAEQEGVLMEIYDIFIESITKNLTIDLINT